MGEGITSIGTGLFKDVPIAVLDFSNMVSRGEVGEEVDDKNIDHKSPVSRLIFINDLGFDNLIKRLQTLKKKLTVKRKAFNATVNNAARRSNKLGKVSGKGKGPGVHDTGKSKRSGRSGKSKQIVKQPRYPRGSGV
jgi:hypothetical protein